MCRILITATGTQRLSELTQVDARAEGHRTLTRFKEEWLIVHDPAWLLAHPNATPEERRARFQRRWAHVLVLVVSFKVDEDTPRFMARPGGGTGDYATSANAPRVIDNAEAVDEATQARITRIATAANNDLFTARKRERDDAERRANPRLQAREERGARLSRGEHP